MATYCIANAPMPVIETDTIEDFFRLVNCTTEQFETVLTSTEQNYIKSYNEKNVVENSISLNQLTIRTRIDLDLNNSEYWNKPSGSIFLNINHLTFNVSGAYPQYRWFFKCLDGGIYDQNGNLTGVHTISNIYLRPDSIFLQVNTWNADPHISYAQCYQVMKNMKLEILTNSGYVAYQPDGQRKKTDGFTNVTFNIKSYNLTNPLFSFVSHHYDNEYFVDETKYYGYTQFENCVINIYLSSINNINDRKNAIFVSRPSSFTTSGMFNFYSCIFRIRNATDKVYAIIAHDTTSAIKPPLLKMDNCALFFNDVGATKPSYPASRGKVTEFVKVALVRTANAQVSESDQQNRIKLINTYFAAFGDVKSNEKVQIYIMCNDAGPNIYPISDDNLALNCSSCFYDSEKVLLKNRKTNPATYEPGDLNINAVWMVPLTTTQCKDPNKLSDIGYIFCEET
jgi:hypothetical protein